MKSPLLYLTAVKLKNQIKDAIKSPAKLIYGLFLIAMLAIASLSGTVEGEAGAVRDLSELTAILVLFYTLMFLLVFINGSAGNTSMFTLSDVNLLFPSPLNPNRVLFYGLFRQLGLSLLLGLVLLFQYSWLHQLYGVTYGHILCLVAGYALTLLIAQFCAMAVYTRFSGRENAARWIKLFGYGSIIIYILAAAYACRQPLSSLFSGGKDYESVLTAAASFFSTFPGLLFPASGWTAGIVGALFTGNWPQLCLCAVLTVLFFILLLVLILRSKNNYYEDVLQTAETAQSAVTAQKEGQMAEVVPKHVKLGKIGLKRGWGASAIYYKHRVENRRSGPFSISPLSLFFAVVVILFAFFMREEAGDAALIAAFAMGTYMQLFSVALGRFNRELIKPYLYLIPEPPLKKLLYAIQETMVTEALEAVLIFVPIAVILQISPFSALFCILARISFSLLFTAGNVFVERVFGTVSSKTLIFLFYFLALIVMALPGIALAVAFSFLLSFLPAFLPAFLGMISANVLVSVLVLYGCRNMLQYAELNGK